MFYKITVILGVIFAIVIEAIIYYEGSANKGILQLVIINFMTVGILNYILPKNSKVCRLRVILVLLAVHAFLLTNSLAVNENNISGDFNLLLLLKSSGDFILSLFWLSFYSFFLPLIIYGLFVVSLVNLFCQKSKTDENNETDNTDTQLNESND